MPEVWVKTFDSDLRSDGDSDVGATLCWWFHDCNRLKMLVTEILFWRLFLLCRWFLQIGFQHLKLVTNTFCLQHPSPRLMSPTRLFKNWPYQMVAEKYNIVWRHVGDVLFTTFYSDSWKMSVTESYLRFSCWQLIQYQSHQYFKSVINISDFLQNLSSTSMVIIWLSIWEI